MRELALSTTEGDLDGSRVPGLRTEKKVDDGLSLRSPSPPVVLDSFSRALMRCEMRPSPALAVFGRRSDDEDCCEIFRNAAPEELALVPGFAEASPGDKRLPWTGLESYPNHAARRAASPLIPMVVARFIAGVLGKNGVRG